MFVDPPSWLIALIALTSVASLLDSGNTVRALLPNITTATRPPDNVPSFAPSAASMFCTNVMEALLICENSAAERLPDSSSTSTISTGTVEGGGLIASSVSTKVVDPEQVATGEPTLVVGVRPTTAPALN